MLNAIGEESKYAHMNMDFLEDGIVSAKTISDLKAVQTSINNISDAVKEDNNFQQMRSNILSDIVQKENQIALIIQKRN